LVKFTVSPNCTPAMKYMPDIIWIILNFSGLNPRFLLQKYFLTANRCIDIHFLPHSKQMYRHPIPSSHQTAVYTSTSFLTANTLRHCLNVGQSLLLRVSWLTMPMVVAAGRATYTGQILCQVLHINTLALEVAGWAWDWYPCGSQLLLPEQEGQIPKKYRSAIDEVHEECSIRRQMLFDWLTDWLTEIAVVWLTDWLTDWDSCCLTDWLTDRPIDWLIDWFIDWLIDWFIYLLTERQIHRDWQTDKRREKQCRIKDK
jgi:hypothetical protein